MKKYIILLGIITLTLLATRTLHHEGERPAPVIKQRLATRLAALSASLQQLRQQALTLRPGKHHSDQLRKQYLQVRVRYKSFEYLAEHLDPVFMKDHINGSPLPKLERNSFGLNVLEPNGMQVLDEAVFAATPFLEKETIIAQTDWLLDKLKSFNTPAFLYDRNVFEAMRTGLIRVFTLGLTGFDTPGSGNAVADATTVLETMQQDIQLYLPFIAQHSKPLADSIDTRFTQAIQYLHIHPDFSQPDRLFVLTAFINPLYKELLDAQEMLEIELIDEVVDDAQLPPYNYRSRNLFANDFIDASRYMTLPRSLYTAQLAALGKTLFFDPVLSLTNERSCASCHDPGKAFTDGAWKSIAMGRQGTVARNAPTLINAVYNERYFYDLRAEALEDQIEHVVVSEKEFNTGIFDIAAKLSKSEEYRALFEQNFAMLPGNKINKQTIAFAISAYVASLRGFNAPFDKYVRDETTALAPAVRRGFNLFMGKAACGTCHFAPVFNGTVPPYYQETESEVLGVPENPYVKKPVLDKDHGRAKGKLTEDVSFYDYSFKTPTVRNAALTAPYMHNGGYKTLDDVMDFYNKGGGKGIGIRLEHQTLPFDKLDLSKQEMQDIIAFMKALTDTTGMTSVPERLPQFNVAEWNQRRTGGIY
jgi:cytochrome c peroxidase